MGNLPDGHASPDITSAAGVELPCNENHEYTRFCHVYDFHDLRRPTPSSRS